jgi:hypothetical protein
MLESILNFLVVELTDLSIYSKYGEWFGLFEDSTQDPKGVFRMKLLTSYGKCFSLGD